jgi:triosephosphate isomerase (TIM)
LRRPVIAGNWKMYKTREETRAFFDAFKPLVAGSHSCDIIVAPPSTSLVAGVEAARGSNITIAAQNAHWEREGAFTGEISMRMIVDCGCEAVIIGHSERRQYFGETDESVNRKVKAALEAKLTPIVCVGESLAEREANLTHSVLKRQFEGGMASLTAADFSRILLAYEPVWAIGTGKTPTVLDVAEMHAHIRRGLAAHVADPDAVRILYGGSVKPGNAGELLHVANVDGALVGGASLKADDFWAIAEAAGR